MIAATFWALALQSNAPQELPMVSGLHAPHIERSPEEKFKLAVGNLFELIAQPDPRYNAFVHLDDRSRVIVTTTRGGGLAKVVEVVGDQGRQMLIGLFGPQSDVTFTFGAPEIEMNGAFGRAKLAVVITEGDKRPQCASAYVDGMLLAPGEWAQYAPQGIWKFSQIVIAFHFDGRCAS